MRRRAGTSDSSQVLPPGDHTSGVSVAELFDAALSASHELTEYLEAADEQQYHVAWELAPTTDYRDSRRPHTYAASGYGWEWSASRRTYNELLGDRQQ